MKNKVKTHQNRLETLIKTTAKMLIGLNVDELY